MSNSEGKNESPPKSSILHVCTREVLRPVRDKILRVAGYDVETCETHNDAITKSGERRYDLVLIDIDGQHHVADAERLCSTVKQADPNQRVAFVCNWRVAVLNECPDKIVRSEFDPVAFLSGVAAALNDNGPAA